MKKVGTRQWIAMLTISSVILAPNLVLAQHSGPAKLWYSPSQQRLAQRVPCDVMLTEGGKLDGRVVDDKGQAVRDAEVRIHRNGILTALRLTDANGRFTARSLSGGTYQVTTEQGSQMYRFWSPRTAPPAARPMATVVQGSVQRGQSAATRIGQWLSNPFVLGGLAITSIAIPMVMDDDDGLAAASIGLPLAVDDADAS